MIYQVVLADSAKADADRIDEWVTRVAPFRGPAWFERLVAQMASFERLPYRCPIAWEGKRLSREIRCLHFGRSRNIDRILYVIDEAAKVVRILHIRHGAAGYGVPPGLASE